MRIKGHMCAQRTKTIMVSCMAIAAATFSQTARAQETDTATAAVNAGQTDGTEIIVTAQKRAQSIQEVPVAITALGADDLEARGIRNLADLARQVPSVNFGEVAGTSQISARGIGLALLTGAGESSVAFHVDGMYISRPSAAGLFQTDVSRIEFLRGPQGTLYGRNATGGVVNIITPEPTDQFKAGFRVGIGNYDLRETSIYVSGPISDNVRFRLSGDGLDRDGYVLNSFDGERIDDARRWGMRAALDADVGNVTAKLKFFYRRNRFKGPSYDPIDANFPFPPGTFDLDPYRIVANSPYGARQRAVGGTLRLEARVSDAITLVSQSNYMDYKFNIDVYDGDGTAVDLFNVTRIDASKSFSQEFNIIGESSRADWVIGAYYLRDRIRQDNLTATPGFAALGILETNSFSNMRVNSYSVFADLTYKVTGAFSLFGGARGLMEHQDIKQTAFLVTPVGNAFLCTPTTPGGFTKQDRSAVTGRFGARYEFSDDANIYGQYSRGYKSGGFAPSQCGNPFKPETINAFEIGSKNRLADGAIDLNLSAFYYDFKNLQFEQIIFTSLFTSNAPKSELYGVDAELLVHPARDFTLNVSGSLLHARFKRLSDTDPLDPGAGLQDLAGVPLMRAPDWTLNAGAQYDLRGGFGTFTIRGDLYATDKFSFRQFNDPGAIQPSYVTFGASLTYRTPDERWALRAWVKNANDRAVLQGVVANPGQGHLGTYAAPRTYGLELSADF